MQDVHVAVNRNARLSVRQVGRDRTPLILIDDFAVDAQPLIDYACSGVEYNADETSYYPGKRASLPRSYVREALNRLYRLLFQVYSVPSALGMKPVNTVYSVIATPEAELTPRQCAPHFDSTRPHYLAVLHYLNPGHYCDTGLFRHRETGFERITEQNVETYVDARNAYAERHGPPPRAYIKDSNEQFELYDRIEYRANRLVVYPGGLLHSGLVDPNVDIDGNPRTGRLTANIFVDFIPVKPGE